MPPWRSHIGSDRRTHHAHDGPGRTGPAASRSAGGDHAGRPRGWAVDDAAEILECPPGTVKSRCHRGRARLYDLLRNPSDPQGVPRSEVTRHDRQRRKRCRAAADPRSARRRAAPDHASGGPADPLTPWPPSRRSARPIPGTPFVPVVAGRRGRRRRAAGRRCRRSATAAFGARRDRRRTGSGPDRCLGGVPTGCNGDTAAYGDRDPLPAGQPAAASPVPDARGGSMPRGRWRRVGPVPPRRARHWTAS